MQAIDSCYAGSAWAAESTAILARPANDNFADAIEIPGEWTPTIGVEGWNACATKEPGEPDHGSHTLWWRWTPSVSGGMVAIETSGSHFDTILAVYTGSSVESLDLVAYNDDTYSGQSLVRFYPSAGTTYHISVGGDGW